MCSTLRLQRSEPLLGFSFRPSIRHENPPKSVSLPYRSRNGSGSVCRASITQALPDQSTLSFYDLLGIPETGSLLEIKKAYKQLARKYHPDVSPPDRVEEYTHRFIEVQEAYETLSDPRRRQLYDLDMENGFRLSFGGRMRGRFDEAMDEENDWNIRWQSQLSELKRRRAGRDSDGNMSWGARMRRARNESSSSF